MSQPITAAMLSCSGTSLTSDEKRLFAQANPLGVNLFARNIANPLQLQNLLNEIRETIGRDNVLIAIDQEGGRVRRLAEPHYRSYAAAITLGSLGADAVRAAKLHAALISTDLRRLGINLNYAPVLDLIHPQTAPVLKSRCFSSNELVVSNLGKAMVGTYIQYGICPCIKHMPGHGRASVDPHLNLPTITERPEQLAADFYPFRQLAYAPVGMTAHIVVSAIDDSRPVTQSPQAIKTLIRGLIGFEGLLISDALDMRALRGTLSEKALLSLQAGCDAVCYALGDIAGLAELTAACPPLSDRALERLSRAAAVFAASPPPAGIDRMAEEYTRLIGQVEPYLDDYDATEVLNKLKDKGEE